MGSFCCSSVTASVDITVNHRHTLRSGRHPTTLAPSSRNMMGVDGQNCNTVIDHYLQEEKCIRNTACNKTNYQSYLPSALVPIATNQKTPNYTSETSRHTSIYRLPLCLFQTVVHFISHVSSHYSREVLPLCVTQFLFAQPLL